MEEKAGGCRGTREGRNRRREMKEAIRDMGKRLDAVEKRGGEEIEKVEERLAEIDKERIECAEKRQREGNSGVAKIAMDRAREVEWVLERKERAEWRGNIVVRGTRIEKGKEKEGLQKIMQVIRVEVEIKETWEVGAKGVRERGIWIARLGSREQKKRKLIDNKSHLRRREEILEEDLTWAKRKTKWKLREIAAFEERRRNRVRAGYVKIWIKGKMCKWDEIGEVLRDGAGRDLGGEEKEGVGSDSDRIASEEQQEVDIASQAGVSRERQVREWIVWSGGSCGRGRGRGERGG
nr:trichohyalin-like [Neodiprion pinetum]XP_046485838.1 trichohyalin-like [Neodiprion pinetum]